METRAPFADVLMFALGMLCALGSATFATAAVRSSSLVVALTSFTVAAIWFSPLPTVTELCVVLAAAMLLVWPKWWFPASALAGGLAGLWVSVLQAQGIPAVGAFGIALSIPAVSVWMTRTRKTFAPKVMQEEALLAMGGFGLILAMGPDVLAGWQTANAMNLDPGSGREGFMEDWLVLLTVGAGLGGGLHALRRRR